MNSYEAKQAARKERLEERSAAQAAEAQATYRRAREMAEAIPFGQPILVGHHSEKRDRNYRSRIESTFRKSFEAQQAAERTAQRAESVGKGGISGDDPDAPEKIRARIYELECSQSMMRETNAAWRKAGKPAPNDPKGWTMVAKILGREDDSVLAVIRRDMALGLGYGQGKQPFDAYALANNSGNINRLNARLAQLERRAEVAAGTPERERMVGDVRVVENIAENRLQLFYPDKPDMETRSKLKQLGFRWAPSNGCWQAHLNPNAKWRAADVLGVKWEDLGAAS